jgi:hypothetical protein
MICIKTSGEQKQRQPVNSPMACADGRSAPTGLQLQVVRRGSWQREAVPVEPHHNNCEFQLRVHGSNAIVNVEVNLGLYPRGFVGMLLLARLYL